VADVRTQREALVHEGFVTATGAARLPDVARYLRGAVLRLEKLPREAERDRGLMAGVHEVAKEWAALPEGPGKQRVRWMIEELRVSLFAQTLKARGPVSVQRVYRAIDDLL
jgi:ATP-dependent helicase HrpA